MDDGDDGTGVEGVIKLHKKTIGKESIMRFPVGETFIARRGNWTSRWG